MLMITSVLPNKIGYAVLLSTDRGGGRGFLYHVSAEVLSRGISTMDPAELENHRIGEWCTSSDNPQVGDAQIPVVAAGYVVACEIEPGPDRRWSAPYPVVGVRR